jgi:hypothetical protein
LQTPAAKCVSYGDIAHGAWDGRQALDGSQPAAQNGLFAPVAKRYDVAKQRAAYGKYANDRHSFGS